MIIDTTNNWFSPRRKINAKVELFNGSTLANTFAADGALKDFSIERTGEGSKFFGFGIAQVLKLNLLDKDRLINLTKENSFKTYINSGGEYLNAFPNFYLEEFTRDENTNEISVVAKDKLSKAPEFVVSDLNLQSPYTIQTVAEAAAEKLGLGLLIEVEDSFNLAFGSGANFDGAENLREVLNAIAEATQTIYFVNSNNELVFKRLDNEGAPVLTIDKAKYISLESKPARILTAIVSATELGENVIAESLGEEIEGGTTQYVRENPFWDLNDNITLLLAEALAAVQGLTIYPFDCNWRGTPALEIGDKIELVTKDNQTIISYVLNDTIKYNGGLSMLSSWAYEEGEQAHANPSTLGEVMKQTFAKVDKVNKEITIVAGETATIKATAESVSASVKKLDENVGDLANEVSAKMSAEAVEISIQKALKEGAEKVNTSTGYTFDENGLTVSKSDSEMKTQITEDGMTVKKADSPVLVANNEGVKAEDLHATTFLIIGNTSRFEDYGGNRTGCFWTYGTR